MGQQRMDGDRWSILIQIQKVVQKTLLDQNDIRAVRGHRLTFGPYLSKSRRSGPVLTIRNFK